MLALLSNGDGYAYDIAQRLKKRRGIETLERLLRVETLLLDTSHRCAVHDRARGIAVSIDTVGSGAEDGNSFTGNFLCAVECKMLIAAACASLALHLHRNAAPACRKAQIVSDGEDVRRRGIDERDVEARHVTEADAALAPGGGGKGQLGAQRGDGAGIGAAWRETLGKNFPPSTLLYIDGLVDVRAKVEIEVTAFVPTA